ncbi:MAG: PAS domain-containing protein [Deltaproteobacteria bacterium]|nr:PAS domain-containing protein [Deltaproteobacteria bacterium]MBW2360344.1 PAS domain-containing protein [Deltaproteobacteria bacterium]
MSQASLLSFLDAPVVVGDPDGSAAYVNPAFETRFSVSAEQVTGEPLARLFEGGVREAVLSSVAEVCETGVSGRFRVKHAGIGYAGLASPIMASDARVGVLILFNESAPDDERVHRLQRTICGPLEELARTLEELAERPAVANDEKSEALLETGTKAVEQLRDWAQDLSDVLSGRRPEQARQGQFDPAEVAASVIGNLAPSFAAAQVHLEEGVPAALPQIAGSSDDLFQALDKLLRARLASAPPGATVAIVARTVERGGSMWVVLAVLDVRPGGGAVDDEEAPPTEVVLKASALGGEVRVSTNPGQGRTTAIRLRALKQ